MLVAVVSAPKHGKAIELSALDRLFPFTVVALLAAPRPYKPMDYLG